MNPTSRPVGRRPLVVQDIRKRYGSLTALDGVSFQVEDGELFGLLGPNGAGKTTLLSILACLLRPTAGQALLGDTVLGPDDADVRRVLGLVPQDLAIYPELSGRENLAFFGRLYGLNGDGLNKRVDEVLAAIGLTDRADDRAEVYSGGMKRRLNLGIAIVPRPRVLLLDEPTTGVDPQSRNHIFEEVRRLNAAGMTVIYTSHYMEEVQALCTRVGILDHGRLIACDTLPKLLKTFDSRVRFRVPNLTPELHSRLRALPGVKMSPHDGGLVVLETADVQGTLARLLALLTELNLQVTGLETQEPNLERVFLHLTGRALRD